MKTRPIIWCVYAHNPRFPYVRNVRTINRQLTDDELREATVSDFEQKTINRIGFKPSDHAEEN